VFLSRCGNRAGYIQRHENSQVNTAYGMFH
jgi:hypothetical protein